jgi:protein-L-isoaspartate O-methyltransferase
MLLTDRADATLSGLVQNATVLELGSGTGFVGIVTASLQVLKGDENTQRSVVFTDVNQEVLQRASENVRLPCSAFAPADGGLCLTSLSPSDLSSLHPRISVRPLDWMDALDESGAAPFCQYLNELRPDIILGADLVRLDAC